MNYSGFTTPLWQWLGEMTVPIPKTHGGKRGTGQRLSTAGLVASWAAFRAPVPWVIATQQFNLVDSHDTARVRTLVGDRARQEVAAALQLTYPGVPCIYYGDEIGLEAENATIARATMPWDEAEWDQTLLAFYRTLIRLRRTSPALAHGGFQVIWAGADSLAFLRDAAAEQLIVVAHRGPAPLPATSLDLRCTGLRDGTVLTELLGGATRAISDGHLALPEQPVGVTIWRTTR